MPAPVVLAALGALLVSLDASLNIALPAVAAAFGIGPAAVRWMIICYVGMYALTALGAGILADRLGALRVFTAGLWLSAVVFTAYWLAPSYAVTLVCRVAQGVSGGLLYGGFGWRAVFLYRAPLALALAVVAARFLGRSLPGGATMLGKLALADVARLAVLRPAVLAFLATFAQF